MRVGSLFSGIGGFDLGLERAGMEIVWQVEIDPYCQRVLARHWPDVPRHGEVRELDPAVLGRADLICGGFPCQPVSLAGRRLGQADDRWLWPEFARIVRGVRPRYVLVENVPGLLSVGGMGDVLGDLAVLGYDAEWESIPAFAVGAPHRRWRVFILAHAGRAERRENTSSGIDTYRDDAQGEAASWAPQSGEDGRTWVLGHADSARLSILSGGEAAAELARFGAAGGAGWWGAEPDVGRMADGVPARVDRLGMLGNAVVPQVAEWIGRRIMAAQSKEGDE